uniref:Secreted protein n=1 Tax=Rhizophora mucronata TaxID=61149 RepID=A0A2P2J4R0_RHIMU
MAQSILCSSMIFHGILWTNCVDDSPSWKVICTCNFRHPCSTSTQCCTLLCKASSSCCMQARTAMCFIEVLSIDRREYKKLISR